MTNWDALVRESLVEPILQRMLELLRRQQRSREEALTEAALDLVREKQRLQKELAQCLSTRT